MDRCGIDIELHENLLKVQISVWTCAQPLNIEDLMFMEQIPAVPSPRTGDENRGLHFYP